MRKFENIGRVVVFLRDPNKKSFTKIIKELVTLMVKKKEIPLYYFKYLYRKRIENYLDYLSAKELSKIGYSELLHKSDYHSLIDNKLFFALF